MKTIVDTLCESDGWRVQYDSEVQELQTRKLTNWPGWAKRYANIVVFLLLKNIWNGPNQRGSKKIANI